MSLGWPATPRSSFVPARRIDRLPQSGLRPRDHAPANPSPVAANKIGVDVNKLGVDVNKTCVGVNKSFVELNKFGVEGNKTCVELNKFGVGVNKPFVEVNKLFDEVNKLFDGVNKLCDELNKSFVGVNKFCVELNKFLLTRTRLCFAKQLILEQKGSKRDVRHPNVLVLFPAVKWAQVIHRVILRLPEPPAQIDPFAQNMLGGGGRRRISECEARGMCVAT